MSTLVLVTLIQMFMGVWNAPATSFGELAFREAVRRQSMPVSVRSVTDADLGPAPERAARPVVAAAATAGVRDTTSAEKPVGVAGDAATAEKKDEAWWRARITAARLALERDRVLVASLENRVSTLTRDVVNRDDPAQRALLVAERLRALEELTSMRKQVTADSEAIAAIEEDARREGVPPGWIRID